MSCVVRLGNVDPPGWLRMFVKGADTAILPFCGRERNVYGDYCSGGDQSGGAAGQDDDGAAEMEAAVQDDLVFFGSFGWRTLCYAQKLIRESDFDAWNREFEKLESGGEDDGALVGSTAVLGEN